MLSIRSAASRAVRAVTRASSAAASMQVPAGSRLMSTVSAGEETEVEELEIGDDVDVATLSAEELIAFVESHEDGSGSQLPIAVEPVLAAHVTPFWKAVEESSEPLEAVQADLAELLETVDRQPAFVGRYFNGPTPRAEESRLVMDVIFGGKISKTSDIQDKELAEDVFPEQAMLDVFLDAGADIAAAPVSQLVRGYLNDLVAANAVYHLRGTYDFIASMADARTTLADVTVQSAVALSDAQQDKIRGAVGQYLPAGKEDAEVDFVVDASISGGLVVTVDSTVIDLSAATFLNQAAANVAVTDEPRA